MKIAQWGNKDDWHFVSCLSIRVLREEVSMAFHEDYAVKDEVLHVNLPQGAEAGEH